MQTPASMVMGIVFAPLGLVLVFTAAITPQWREGQARLAVSGPDSVLRAGLRPHRLGVRPGAVEALLLVRSDGLWESCLQMAPPELKHCWPVSGAYQKDPRVRLAQGLTLTSLFLCGTGIVLACIGVRCWKDLPLRGVAATGGLLMVFASLLSLTALSVYTHNLSRLGLHDHSSHRHTQLHLRPAGSLYFGWLGSCLQMLGGVALMFSLKRPKCPTCPACPELPACTCPESSNKANMDVYEVSC
ncbi:claudin-23 [Boleophthalmus pectinirostris]|uniref:claudin-23 n=1 Tax=Boleophthalmus pectinirostris TaxID=150288 RepID=UPI000A1C6540|nr:claudin-23 [Boleophthalmus pectinirostris]